MPDLEPLRVRDLIRIDGSDADELCSFVARVAGAVLSSACGVVVNTSEGIEAPELAALRRELSRPASPSGRFTCCPGRRRSRSSTPRPRLPSVA